MDASYQDEEEEDIPETLQTPELEGANVLSDSESEEEEGIRKRKEE